MCINMTVNISLTGDTEVTIGASRNTITASGQITGLSTKKLLGVSWAYYSDYASGYPQWKENYIDGNQDYVSVYPANPNFSRVMADTVVNYDFDYVVVFITRDPNDLSIITAERYFRIYKGVGMTSYYPLTDTIIHVPDEQRKIIGTVTNSTYGTPLPYVTVTFVKKSAVTGSDGKYTILDPDFYSAPISATLSGYESYAEWITSPSTGILTHNIQLTPVGVPPPVERKITGVITDSTYGTPVAYATVTFMNKSAITGTDGKYIIKEPEKYSSPLEVECSGYEPYSEMITAPMTGEHIHNVSITPVGIPPPADYPKDITREEYTFVANNNTEEIYLKGFLGISPATVPMDALLATKVLQGLTDWKDYWNTKWDEVNRADLKTFTNNKFLEFKNKLTNGTGDDYKKYLIPAIASIAGALIIVSGRKK